MERVITRFPPSPTGLLHIGNVRTALFNFLFARRHGGQFLVRIEDTDRARSKKDYEDDILSGLEWLGLSYDSKLWRQSERTEIYRSHLRRLIDGGHAYLSAEEEGERREVVRFKNPNRVVSFTDLIRGTVTFDTTELKDFIIARSADEPLYHLAVVVDDTLSEVTHVIRGEDHISNTPRQILITEALGAPLPTYAHLPLILAPDRSKLSKREHGEIIALRHYKAKGYLPEAMVNFLALLGWNPGTEREIFSMDELIEAFDLSKVQKSGAVFNEEKLRWINREYLKQLPQEKIKSEIETALKGTRRFALRGWSLSDELIEKLLPVLFERIHVWSDIAKLAKSGELDYWFEAPQYETDKLYWKEKKENVALSRLLQEAVSLLEGLSEGEFRAHRIKETLMQFAESHGRGEVLWALRFALTGKDKSPDPFTVAWVLGRSESLSRLSEAVRKLSNK